MSGLDLNRDAGTQFLHEEHSPPPTYQKCDELSSCGSSDSCADIVFVQGLASRYQTTWSVEDPTELDGRYYWLRQKLPRDVRNGRILAFEYDSSWYENPAYVDLEDCATWLLESLVCDRKHPEEDRICPLNKRKPLILVGHSFGGLVIKQALVMAGLSRPAENPVLRAQYLNHQDLLSMVAGIIFLGTPHRGTTFSRWASLKMSINSLLGQQVHDELVNLLTLNNPVLKSLHRQFSRLLERELCGLRIYCFYETHSVRIPPQVVVPEKSASLDCAENIPLAANHIELNKFHKDKDKNYDLFVNALRSTLHGSRELVAGRLSAQRYNDMQASLELQNLKRWLSPSTEVQAVTHSTRLKEQRSAPFTCSWIAEVDHFKLWLASNESNPLWIYGPAGSGKSILCSYLIEMLNTASRSDEVTYVSSVQDHNSSHCQPRSHSLVLYYLNGVDKEHETPWAFIGTLVHQLLLASLGNEQVFKIALSAYNSHQRNLRACSADTEVILALLQTLLASQKTVYILVDGLEENSDLTKCLQLLALLRNMSNVRFIFFSQDVVDVYSTLLESFPSLMSMFVGQYTAADIENFTMLKVEQLAQQKPELAAQASHIKRKLLSGADGVFQWINESISHLRSIAVSSYNIEDCLKEIPVGLHSSYDKIFARMARADISVKRRAQVALRWLTVAARPLSVRDIWTAIRLESRGSQDLRSVLDKCTAEPLTDEEMVAELYQLLGPLLRLSDSPTSGYYASLVHPSLRVAITGRPVNEDSISQTESFYFSEPAAHLLCAQICMEICADTTLQLASCRGTSLPPLVDYAWSFFAYHRNLCGKNVDYGHDQMDSMILGIARDCIVFLNALLDFASTHLPEVRFICNDLQSTLAVKMAQDSLLPAVEAIMLVSQNRSFAVPLHEARQETKADLILRRKPTQSMDTEQQLPDGWFAKIRARIRRKIVPAPSAALRLKVDSVYAQRPQLGRNQAGVTRALTTAAQHLRVVALRFSAEPIAESMRTWSQSESLSAIFCLTRVANLLEECGNYPYWILETVSSHQAYSAPFSTVPDGDPLFGPAMYVLQALDGSNINNTKVTWSGEDRAGLLEQSPPGPLEITPAHEEHMNQVHQLPGSSYIVALHTHAILNISSSPELSWWTESIKQAHVEASLMLRRVGGQFMTADQLLASYVPESYVRNEHQEYLLAIPQLLKIMYMHYITMLLEFFGGLTKAALAVQISSLRMCFNDFEVISSVCSTCLLDNGLLTKTDLSAGLVILVLRHFYFRWYALFYSIPTWTDLYLGFRHPAPFLSLEASIGFWEGATTGLLCFGIEMLHLLPVQLLPVYSTRGTWSNRLLRYTVSFHVYLIVERMIFRLFHLLVTAVAAGRVMFSTPESVGGAVDFSIFYWLLQAWNIALNMGRTALTQGYDIQGLGSFALTLLQTALVLGFSLYFGSIFDLVKRLFYPLLLPYWILIQILFLPWAKALRILGAATIVLMVGFAVFVSWQYWKDPYGLRHSLNDLERARSTIHSSEIAQHETKSLKNIGQNSYYGVVSGKQPTGRIQRVQDTLSKPSANPRHQATGDAEVVTREPAARSVPTVKRVITNRIKME